MSVSVGLYTAVYGSGVVTVTHPSLDRPAEYFADESRLLEAIDYTRRKIVERPDVGSY